MSITLVAPMNRLKNIPWRLVREWFFNLVLAAFLGMMGYNFLHDFLHHHKISSLFYVVFETIAIIFSFSRCMPKSVSWKPVDWTLALLATALPLCLPASRIVSHLRRFGSHSNASATGFR